MGVSTKVFVNFKDFSQVSLHIVKDFIDYLKLRGYTNKTNFLGKNYLDDLSAIVNKLYKFLNDD